MPANHPAIEPVTLTGTHVELVPLSHDHGDALAAAARDGELWRLWYTSVPRPDAMPAEVDRRLALAAAGLHAAVPRCVMAPAASRSA